MNRTDLIEIDGKKYDFIPDEIGDGSECERCAFKDKCHDEDTFICNDQYGMAYAKGKRFVEINEGVIKDYEMPSLCNMQTARETGFAVILTLSTKYDYTSAVLEDWRKRLEADDYMISVRRNQLRVRFNVMY